jgi:hypothetical protein
METLPAFLAKFSELLMRESKGELALDGRRLGFMYRNILAVRAVELARGNSASSNFVSSAKYAIESSIPVGINKQSINKEEVLHKVNICFDLLSDYFQEGSQIERVNRIYELFTTRDVVRKASLLLKEDLSELARTKAWTDMINSEQDMTVLAYVALQIEAKQPGVVPQEIIAALAKKIDVNQLGSSCLPRLRGESIEYVEDIERLLEQRTDLMRLIAIHRVDQLLRKEKICQRDINESRELIQKDTETFHRLLSKEVKT